MQGTITQNSESSGVAAELRKISKTMLRDQTYASLKKAILTGRIAPGEKLNIRKLAAVSDLSSTPIREAFLMLEHEGIVVRSGGGQFSVRQFSQREVEQIFRLRSLLEPYGAAEAMENMTEKDIVFLEENIRQSEKALAQGLLGEVSDLNAEFHNYLIGVSKDEVLQVVFQGISDKIWISRSIALYAAGKAENSITEHRKIVSAIRDRNMKGLKQAVKEHIVTAHRIVTKETAKTAGKAA